MNYIIVTGTGSDELSKKVNDKIKEGFIPIGGVAITQEVVYKVSYACAQAMIKPEEKDNGKPWTKIWA